MTYDAGDAWQPGAEMGLGATHHLPSTLQYMDDRAYHGRVPWHKTSQPQDGRIMIPAVHMAKAWESRETWRGQGEGKRRGARSQPACTSRTRKDREQAAGLHVPKTVLGVTLVPCTYTMTMVRRTRRQCAVKCSPPQECSRLHGWFEHASRY
jgi:hypothetical protein